MRQEGPDPRGFCVPGCVWFKCGKQPPALQIRGRSFWCTWLNDICIGPRCQYAICVRGKMMPDNRCGLVVRRVTTDAVRPDDFKIDVKIKGKIAQRLKDDRDLV